MSSLFFAILFSFPFPLFADTPALTDGCVDKLRAAVCETNASGAEIHWDHKRIECGAGSADLVPPLQALALELPEDLRPALCSVEKIFVTPNITSAAAASPVVDSSGKLTGAYIALRRSTLLDPPSIDTLATWKEQLAFGGKEPFLGVRTDLVRLHYGLRMDSLRADGVFYVLVHELGHLIDYHNGITGGCGPLDAPPSPRCKPAAGSWGALSWATYTEPLPEASFLMRDQFCFYNCARHLDPDRAFDIYSSLAASAFLSSYAAVNVREDFAEYLAWYVMMRFKSARYQIHAGGKVIDMSAAAAQNPRIARKLRFIDSLWRSGQLKLGN